MESSSSAADDSSQDADPFDRGAESAVRGSGQSRPGGSDEDARALHICAIGASAGGLEALREFFTAIPTDLGVVYVVIQHLSPDHESKMPQLLARVTDMPVEPVREANQGQDVFPDRVYLIPPGRQMALQGGRLFLSKRESDEQLTLPIDHFLLSLARDQGRNSIAVILSGTGGDGSGGVAELHRAGGMVLAQDPDTAKFGSMPERTLAIGVNHVVAPPAGLAHAIARFIRQSLSREQLEELSLSTNVDPAIAAVLEVLRGDSEIDFGIYKMKTVMRRIRRRLELRNAPSVGAYLDELESNEQERRDLVSDLLIGVTSFFRDPEAFDMLQHETLAKIIAAKNDGEELRAWVAGCATGEEAYSVAMMIDSVIRRTGKKLRLKLFASDTHRAAVDTAAAGIYPAEAVEELRPEYRERYFVRTQTGFQVISRLRQQIVFVCHNLIVDAPFTRMDLVTCRNLLIYLQPQAQKKVLALFHFSLRPGGFLFLGSSESLGDLEEEFEAISKKWRIFRKLRDVQLATLRAEAARRSKASAGAAPRVAAGGQRLQRLTDNKLQNAYDALLSELVPAGFLVAENGQLLHTFGGGGEFLHIHAGRYSDRLSDIIHPDLKSSLGAALQHCIHEQQPVEYHGIRVAQHSAEDSSGGEYVLSVRPIQSGNDEPSLLLVALRPDQLPHTEDGEAARVDVGQQDQSTVATLQRELTFTRENLQATIQELEASNEEMQATNEEMTASNEELQSTNEELQSVNEELHTVNAEYHRKIAQLQEANDDMDNLLTSSEVAVLFLDQQLRIRRYTPRLELLLGLRKQDVGRDVHAFQSPFLPAILVDRLQQVLSERQPSEQELVLRDGRTFLVHSTAFVSTTMADGVVLTYSDVTAIRRREDAELRWASIVESTSDCIIAVDLAGEITQWNRAAEKLYEFSADEARGRNFFDLVVPREHREEMAVRLEQVRSDHQSKQFDSRRVSKSGKRIEVSVRLSPVVGIQGNVGISSIERDVTRERRRSKLYELEESARGDVSEHDGSVWGLDLLANQVQATLAPSGFSIWRLDPHSRELVAFVNQWSKAAKDLLHQHGIELESLREKCRDSQQPVVRTFETTDENGRSQPWLLTFKPLIGKSGTLGVLAMLIGGTEHDEVTEIRTTLRRIASLLASRIEYEQHFEALLRVSEIVENAADFIGSTDSAGKVVSLNRAGRLLTGIGLDDDVTQMRIKDFHPSHVTRQLMTVALPETRRVGHWSGESAIVDRLGTEIPVNQLIICHRGPDGEVRYFSTICRMIAEQKSVQSRLEQMISESRDANDAGTRFVANISHDVRTPMTSVIGLADLLLSEDLDPSHRDMVESIRVNGEYVTTLLNDLLELSRADAGKMNIRPKPLDLLAFCEEIVAVNKPLFEGAPVEFVADLEIAPSTRVLVDRTRVRQIVENLLDNARKFTVQGSICLKASYADETLTIMVRDTGCGIEQSLLSNVFDPNEQVDPAIGPRSRDAGLGLAISRKLALAMGGEMETTSESGHGSTFTVIVPAPMASDSHGAAEEKVNAISAEDLGKLHGRRILIAEDSRGIQFFLRSILEKHGMRVTVVPDGAQAIDAINENLGKAAFDVLLLDMQMPVLDGHSAARTLRDADVAIPIVAMSATPSERQAALSSGCDDFVGKPIDQTMLLRKLIDCA